MLTNEGGQPVYLEDLQLLQDMSWGLMTNLIRALSGTDGGFLLNLLEISTTIAADATLDTRGYATVGGVEVSVSANAIVYQGNIIPFEAATFTDVEQLSGIKVGIRITETDVRTCADGQAHPCRQQYTAFLYSGESANAQASFDLYDLECLEEIIARRTGIESPDTRWKQMPVIFYNGYSGTVRYTLGTNWRLKINVRSANTEWEADNPNYSETNPNMYVGLIAVMTPNKTIGSKFDYMRGDRTSSILLRPDGSPRNKSVESEVETTHPAHKIVINNFGSYYDENDTLVNVNGRGQLLPCMEGDSYGTIISCMYDVD